jgi:glycosyltransferase involved in cell wall biosynthesis
VKIIYHHRIRSKDGQSVHLAELIDALRDLGHEVLLVGPPSFDRASFGHDPALLSRAKEMIPKAIYELMELGYNVVAYFRLLHACIRFRPDFIYERANLFFPAGILVKKSYGVPLLLEVNSPLSREREKFGGLGLRKLATWMEAWTWRHADVVLPVTDVLANELRNHNVDEDRVVVIPNAIDVEKFPAAVDCAASKARMGLSGKFVLGFTGFVRAWHGLDQVIHLLAKPQIPHNVHFIIVGDGPAIAELKAISGELGVAQRVTFAGLVERKDIARTIAAFDIALLPQCVDYCSPLKIFEYMAGRKAIVAPDQGNIREILMPGVSALLFAPGEHGSMTKAIVQLIEDDALRERLGRNAFDQIQLRGYTWRRNAERVGAIGASLGSSVRVRQAAQ